MTLLAFPSFTVVDAGHKDPYQGDVVPEGTQRRYFHSGMSLRDYFAAAALTGICANESLARYLPTPKKRAEAAYVEADAMIQERGQ